MSSVDTPLRWSACGFLKQNIPSNIHSVDVSATSGEESDLECEDLIWDSNQDDSPSSEKLTSEFAHVGDWTSLGDIVSREVSWVEAMVCKKDWRTSSSCIVGVELEIETNSNIKHFKAGSHCVKCCAACRLGLSWSKSLARLSKSSGAPVGQTIMHIGERVEHFM